MKVPINRKDEYREVAWAKPTPGGKFTPIWINRPHAEGHFVKFDILYCGVCHSDVHIGENELGNAMFPCVPGHECVGIVTEIGRDVTRHFPGERVGIGPIIDSCLNCQPCADGTE